MPAPPPRNDNRRRHPRREVLATAMVFTAHRMHGTFLLQDLSAGGACLVGHLDLEPGTELTLIMQCPGRTPFSPGVATGFDMLEFLGEYHPHIQRVVMADEIRPFRLDLALRSGRAHRVLRKPWDRRGLAEAVGVKQDA